MGQSARLAAHWYATAIVLVASAVLRLLTPPRWYPLWWAVAELGLGVVVGALAWWVSRGARPARPAALATGGVIVVGAVVLAVLDIGYEFAAVPAVVGLLATATSPEAFGRTTGMPPAYGEAWTPASAPGPRPGVTAGLPVPAWQPGTPSPAGGPPTDGLGRQQPQGPQGAWAPAAQQWPPAAQQQGLSPQQQGPSPQQQAPASYQAPPQQQTPVPRQAQAPHQAPPQQGHPHQAPWPGAPQAPGPSVPAVPRPEPRYPPGVRSAQDRMATEYGPAGRSVPALGEDAPPAGPPRAGSGTPVPATTPYPGTRPSDPDRTVSEPPEPAGTEGGPQAGDQVLRARRHRVPAPQEPETREPEIEETQSREPETIVPVLPEAALPRPTWEFDPTPRGRRAAPRPEEPPDDGERGVEWAPRRRRHATPEPEDGRLDDRQPDDDRRATEEE